ncbi:hypothetical protein, partial [Intrasporangium sp.]|uniref:hypothetical protein n=1 Tax=Intrasporangium sp. TaxID=1925024 RepID=UPI002B46A7C0
MPTGLGRWPAAVAADVVVAGFVGGADVEGGAVVRAVVGAAPPVADPVGAASVGGVTGGGRSARYTRTMSTSKKAISPAVINPRFIR